MSEAEPIGGTRARIRKLAVWTGAAVSLALVVGSGFWGWRLLEREAVGVPIVRAAPGPMRIAPQEPGGDLAENQGLSVSLVAAGAGEIPLASEVYLAPHVVEFAAEDMPAGAEPPAIDATDLAVAEALGLDPSALVAASAPAERRTAERTPLVTADGDEAVQLGAFPEEDVAAAEWRSLVGRFPDLLENTERRIERVEREDRTFWRLRAGGFDDLADARRVCAALTAGGAECVPVVLH